MNKKVQTPKQPTAQGVGVNTMVVFAKNHNGFNECPKCRSLNVGPQTPAENDMIVRRMYARCFDCGHESEHLILKNPIRWQDTGILAINPILKSWNVQG